MKETHEYIQGIKSIKRIHTSYSMRIKDSNNNKTEAILKVQRFFIPHASFFLFVLVLNQKLKSNDALLYREGASSCSTDTQNTYTDTNVNDFVKKIISLSKRAFICTYCRYYNKKKTRTRIVCYFAFVEICACIEHILMMVVLFLSFIYFPYASYSLPFGMHLCRVTIILNAS